MPFAAYEYDRAFSEFFSQSMLVLAQAMSPLLAQMQFIETSGTVGSRVRDREGMDLALDPGHTLTDFATDLRAVRSADLPRLYDAMSESADSMTEQLVGFFIESLGKITEATGNITDVGGRPLGFDVLYELLERMEFSVDENDDLVMPSLLMNPAQAEQARKLPPLTEDQEQQLAELKARKRNEALARRRRRRLS